MKICVDASLVIKWISPEDNSDTALKLLEKWKKEEALLIAPTLLDFEVGSTLRQKVLRKQISQDDLFQILHFYERLSLLLLHITNSHLEALSIAAALQEPTTYDVSYLLTAKQQKAKYVTADKRFQKKTQGLFDFCHYFEDCL